MLTPRDMDPDVLVPRIAADLDLLYMKLDEALGIAIPYFDKMPGGVDRSLLPNMVRYHLRLLLEQHGIASREFDDNEDVDPGHGFERLANNGLELHLLGGQVKVRVRMNDRGRLPIPGSSKTLQAFYNQTLWAADQAPDEIRLVAVWAWRNTGLDYMNLHCPRSGAKTRGSVSEHWARPVLDPLVRLGQETVEALERDLEAAVASPVADMPAAEDADVLEHFDAIAEQDELDDLEHYETVLDEQDDEAAEGQTGTDEAR